MYEDDLNDLKELLYELERIVVAIHEIVDNKPLRLRVMDLTDGGDPHCPSGKVIKKLRKQAGLTQVELSKKSGVLQNHISRIETGDIQPTVKTIKKIAAALGVPVEKFFTAID